VTFFFNVEKYGTARQATGANLITRMRFACLINKARHTLAVCNTYCFSTAIMVSRTNAPQCYVYTYIFPVVFFSRTTVTTQNTPAR